MKRKTIIKKILSFVLSALFILPAIITTPVSAAGTIHLSKYFSNGMVLQRNKPIRVWGTAASSLNGETVSATFMGKTASSVISDGKFIITFEEGFETNDVGDDLVVSCGTAEDSVDDVLVGDVYMFIGQSNIWLPFIRVFQEYNTFNSDNGMNKYVVMDPESPIRINRSTAFDLTPNNVMNVDYYGYNSTAVSDTLVRTEPVHNRGWENAYGNAQASALAYIIAEQMNEKLDIPIGVIQVDASGCSLASFVPASMGGNWTTAMKRSFAYNQLIYPLINASISALIWYQGESDASNTIQSGSSAPTEGFVSQFPQFISFLRSSMAHPDFPVFFVEFAPIFNDIGLGDGKIRAESSDVANRVPNCYVAPSLGAWTRQNDNAMINHENHYHYGTEDQKHYEPWHPWCKPAQANYVIDLMLNTMYGGANINNVAAPKVKTVEYQNSNKTAIITFENVGDGGLKTYSGSANVTGIKVINKSYTEHNPSTQKIINENQVQVTYSSAIYGVNYGAETDSAFPESCTLMSSTGIPALSFARYRTIDNSRYPVTFHTNGGSAVSTQLIASGGRATEPIEPKKTNFNFDGWYTDSLLTIPYNFNSSVTAATDLYAKWDDGTARFTVSFDSLGGTVVSSERVEAGGCATRPADPVKSGSNFTGWYTDENCTVPYDFSSAVNENITLYAGWEEIVYTVTVVPFMGGSISDPGSCTPADGGNVSFNIKEGQRFDEVISQFPKAMKNDSVPAAILFLRNGQIDANYIFHWYNGNPATMAEYTAEAGTVAYIFWDTSTVPKSVTFNTNGGTMTSGLCEYYIARNSPFSSVMSALPTAEKEGFEFDGWYDGNVKLTSVDEIFTGENDTTYVASWKKNYTPGDVNADGTVDAKDVTVLGRYLNGWSVVIDENASDVNTDDKVDAKDVTLIRRYLNGWQVVLG